MPWTRKLSFGEYAKEVLSSSSIRPVSQVFSSSSHFSKAFNIFIFAISISGCLYQLITFLSMYFENPTIVEAYLTTPSNMLLPAVTLCNINGISRTDYCKLHPCHVIPKKKLCKRYPVYCLLSFNNDLDDKVPYSNITEIFNYSEEDLKPYRNNFLNDVSKQVAQLLDTDRRTVDVFKFEVGASVRSLLRNPPVCHTVNLMRNQTKRRHEFIPTTYSLFFPKIYLYAEDIIYGPEYAAIQASVHSPYSYTNPFIAGFELKIGKFYTFRVKQVEKNLLPWPYKTNCFNYLEKIKQNGKPGPINQKECVENCKVNFSLKMLGCVLRSIWYPHNYRRCEPRNERDLLSYYHKNCSQQCQPACSEVTYEVTKDEQYSDGEYKCLTDFKALMISSVATALQVTFEPAAKTVYTVIPKYQTLEVISSIGDIIGLWIGLSLIAFFNFIEQIMRIILYPCQVADVTRRTKVIRMQGIAMHNA